MLPLGAAMLDMLELQSQLESKAAKRYATVDITNPIFLSPFGIQYTWKWLPWGGNTTRTPLEQGKAAEHP